MKRGHLIEVASFHVQGSQLPQFALASILITTASDSHKSPPHVLTDSRHPVALNAAARTCEISRIFQMSKMLSSMATGRVRPKAASVWEQKMDRKICSVTSIL